MARRRKGPGPAGAADHPEASRCHWPGCQRQVPPHSWACAEHWAALPKSLRDRVARAYRPGQEIDKQPSREYIRIAQEVHHVVRRGDSLWELTQAHAPLPLWLLRQYNPDLDLERLVPGARIVIPQVVVLNTGERTSTTAQAPR